MIAIHVKGYCPMGCGRTLIITDGGFLTCARPGCPRPDAPDLVLNDADVQRLIDEEIAPISAERDEALAEVARLEDWLAVASREAVDARAAFEKERRENQLLEADLTVAVHEAIVARAKLAGHYCGG